MSENKRISRDRDLSDDDRLAARIESAVEAKAAAGDEKSKVTRERLEAFRDQWANSALPEISKDSIPGYHLCWLSTTNTYDTIDKRIALGYEPVKAYELGSSFETLGKMNSGKFEGCVSCNEMILFKIPSDLYQEAMKLMHYEMPLEHQQNITANLRGAAENDKGGRTLLEGGLLEMEKGKVNPDSMRFDG